jgi:hypothetical protein
MMLQLKHRCTLSRSAEIATIVACAIALGAVADKLGWFHRGAEVRKLSRPKLQVTKPVDSYEISGPFSTPFVLVAVTLNAMAADGQPCAIRIVSPSGPVGLGNDYPSVAHTGEVSGTAEMGPEFYIWIFTHSGAESVTGRMATALPASLEVPSNNRGVLGRWVARVRYRIETLPDAGLASIWVIAVDKGTNDKLVKRLNGRKNPEVNILVNDVTPQCQATQTVRTGMPVRAPEVRSPATPQRNAMRRHRAAWGHHHRTLSRRAT